MVSADPRVVLPALVQARSSSLLRAAYVMTGDRAAAERLLRDALADVHRRKLVDPLEAESLVRASMARLCGHPAPDSLLEPDVDVEVSAEWRADLTDELHAPPPPPRDWSWAVVAAAVAVVVAIGLVVLPTDPSPRAALPAFGNAWVLDQMHQGAPARVDAAPLQTVTAQWGSAVGTDRVLAQASDQCDGVYVLRGRKPRLVRTWCSTRLLSLSPDGRTVLVGRSEDLSGVPSDLTPAGLMDLRTGDLTTFPELADLDQYRGDDLVGFAWEDNETVVFAYLADRPNVRTVRCTHGNPTCEVTAAR